MTSDHTPQTTTTTTTAKTTTTTTTTTKRQRCFHFPSPPGGIESSQRLTPILVSFIPVKHSSYSSQVQSLPTQAPS